MRLFLAKFFLLIFSGLPLPLLHGIGFILGHGLWWSSSRLKKVAQKNICLCFPDLSPIEQSKFCRRSLIELGKTATETAFLWKCSKDKMLRQIRQISGKETLEQTMAANRGIIFVSPHFGAWELAGAYCSSIAKMTILYKPPKLAGMENITLKARQKFGATAVPTNAKGVRQLYTALRKGECIGILPDQDPADGGVFAPFFGISTNTMTLLPRLASTSKAAVFYAIAERLPWGRGYHLHLLPSQEQIYSKDPVEAATAVNQNVEQCIALCPQQYQWSYKRFKTRPPGEAKLYD